jgi:hypothetical protein
MQRYINHTKAPDRYGSGAFVSAVQAPGSSFQVGEKKRGGAVGNLKRNMKMPGMKPGIFMCGLWPDRPACGWFTT